ncbi:glycosyl transferase (plasmid) [Salipiger sp. CCB-MM3]|uniref:glycosyltransferase family 2 protein n=1 Tax=Salipiger sp. CCB-MM3 TaxID=1792508 RepID=UPI00080AAD34|nr:glycosyltransferase family 2 protein [Salipiger sp. CCB-MM3]ANT63802.1 glycosyl transferase [Salipiger sp. CCB-MM3]
MTPTSSIAAVIVTYNRVDKLAKVLDALEGQTRVPDKIYVVDNASTDGTRDLLEKRASERLVHLRLAKNIGGAGGFNAGMKAAYADGFDLIWISDDDAYPHEDALGKLIDGLARFEEVSGHRPTYACSAVRWIDGSWCEMNTPATVWDWPRFYSAEDRFFMVRSCSFVSVLVPRWAIAQHGFPIKDYFIWFDDAEYTQRLAMAYPGIFIPDSLVTHDVGVNQGVNYGMITEQSIWKYKYGARNETSFRRREFGMPGVLEFLYQVRTQMVQGRLPKKLRWPIYKAIWNGIWFRPEIEMPPQND